jgi:hypothetical protein
MQIVIIGQLLFRADLEAERVLMKQIYVALEISPFKCGTAHWIKIVWSPNNF